MNQTRGHDDEPFFLFSEEIADGGKRNFIVATRPDFWKFYAKLRRWRTHHYEIIREGRPCHLYFDLEFYTEPNPGLDGST